MDLPFQMIELFSYDGQIFRINIYDKYFILIDNLKKFTKSIKNFKSLSFCQSYAWKERHSEGQHSCSL